MFKLLRNLAVVFTVLVVICASCVKKDARDNNFPAPNIEPIPEGTVYTIAELLEMWGGLSDYSFTFTEDASVYGIVTADETSGNLYKQAFIESNGAAIELYLNATSALRIGDSVRVCLKGATLSSYKGLPQIQDLDPNNIIILKNNCDVTPVVITLSEISMYLCRFVQIDNAEFKASDTLLTYAEPDDYGNRTLYADCNDDESVIVRTSSYSSFALQPVPSGKGSIKGIVTVYNTEMQLVLRSLKDVDLTGERCTY